MSGTSNTGHANNVVNYEKLIADVTALDITFNPSKANLKPTELNSWRTSANVAIAVVNTAESIHTNAANIMDADFVPASNLVNRVNNAFKAADTTPQIKESPKTLVRLFPGSRATPKPTKVAMNESKASSCVNRSCVPFRLQLYLFIMNYSSNLL
jgi:hypothetical protein